MNEEVINMFPETISCAKRVTFSLNDMQMALNNVKTGKSITEQAYKSNASYPMVRENCLKLKDKTAAQQNMMYMEMPKLTNITSSNNVMGHSIPIRRPSQSDELQSFENDSNCDIGIFKIQEVDYMQNTQQNNGSTTGNKITSIFPEIKKHKRKIKANISMRNNTADISENVSGPFNHKNRSSRNIRNSRNNNNYRQKFKEQNENIDNDGIADELFLRSLVPMFKSMPEENKFKAQIAVIRALLSF